MTEYKKIACKICEREFNGQISASHLRTHEIDTQTYRIMYGPTQTDDLLAACRSGGSAGGGNVNAKKAHAELAATRRQEYYSNPKSCPHCQTIISFENKSKNTYCSSKCAATYGQQNKGYRPRLDKRCMHCDISLSKYQKKYCSQTCQNAYERGQVLTEWLNGQCNYVSIPRSIRSYLLDEASNKCSQCSWSGIHPKTGESVLHIDHVNGDSMDHRPANLRVLCPNCHSMTDTFGAHNKGNKGRVILRKERQ